MSAEIQRSLSAYGTCIPLPPFLKLPHPVSCHPDMLMARIGGTLFIHEEYTEGQALLRTLGLPFALSHTPVEKDYPQDVRLNCFSLNEYLFANKKALSTDVLCFAKEKEMTLLSVRQGYTKCATAVAGGAIATADPTIAKAAEAVGIPTLRLPSVRIGIECYDTGFLGGTCVAIDDKLLFFGKIENNPHYTELRNFFKAQGISLVSLGENAIFDYGGAVITETFDQPPA